MKFEHLLCSALFHLDFSLLNLPFKGQKPTSSSLEIYSPRAHNSQCLMISLIPNSQNLLAAADICL